jgi:hypothetical protein
MKTIKSKFGIFFFLLISFSISACSGEDIIDEGINNDPEIKYPYAIPGTNQTTFYNNQTEIAAPAEGELFYGQDATYPGHKISYTNNGDGTITDNITGLMWSQTTDLNGDDAIDYNDKLTYSEAVSTTQSFDLAGYTDWRLPTIKELYSLIIFSGRDIDPRSKSANSPFIDTGYFGFAYGDINTNERIIDAQMASSTLNVGDTQFGGGNLMFGVNFADGRIKGYPTGAMPNQSTGKKFYVFFVRENESYGINNFTDNGDGTVTDNATGLMWMQNDSGEGMNWQEALEFAENAEFAGYSDWRMPDAKELQSIVDYSRAPGATNSAAINPVFKCTQITNEAGQPDYAYYWTGTTHANAQGGGNAAYISFGRALGYFNGVWQDVHGAGAQRSDPKTGDASNWPTGHGPQGDAIRIENFVRLVRKAI